MVALFYGIKSLRTFNYRLLIVVLSVICIGLGFYSINTIVKHQILESKPLQTMSIDNNSSIHTDDKIKSLSRSYDRERILL